MIQRRDAPDPDRRSFLVAATRSTLAVAVLGPVACSTPVPSADPTGTSTGRPASPTTGRTDPASDRTSDGDALAWERADLGFVSAYVLVRSGRAAVVDTGVSGSADQVEAALGRAGVAWDDVVAVILTHRHPDHVGSVGEVAARAPGATVHAGAADVAAVPLDGVAPLEDGDRVLDLTIVATPGHTPGHVSVYDPGTGVLVAGDALNGNDDGSAVLGPDPEFTPDMGTARASVGTLAELDVDTALFGHGEPYVGGAGAQIAGLVGG